MSGERNRRTRQDLVFAAVQTLIAVVMWILLIVSPNWLNAAQYLAVFVTVGAILGWIRYVIARRSQTS
ncbi:hypothetical protein AB0F91_45665 [Amycolatopsis sp. NPDC023774]|uniref:hypothetical protein n=1 Tax=Amycolatopsis sp. NPDC023774 TaxID=3155015 RepID=UPI0034042944